MALYYNIAVDRMMSLLRYLTGSDEHWNAIQDDKLGNLDEYFDGRRNKFRLKLPVYAFLKSYFFYSSPLGKNETINISTAEKRFFVKMLMCLNDFRNWHSHSCHSNHVLEFSSSNQEESILFQELKGYMQAHYNTAVEKTIGDDAGLKDYFFKQLNPQIFSWLDLLDMNVWVILLLMLVLIATI